MPADAPGAGDRRPRRQLTEGEVKLIKDWVEKGASSSPCWIPAPQVGLEGTFRAGASRWARTRVIDPEAQNPEVAIAQSYAEAPDHAAAQLALRPRHHLPVARPVSKRNRTP